MEGEKTKYHAEVKIIIQGHEARINCFTNTLAEVFKDIGIICAQFPSTLGPAKREIANAETKAKTLGHPKASMAFDDKVVIPVCANCGSSANMELITFTDKKTGQLRKAWKCQECQEWYWSNGKRH